MKVRSDFVSNSSSCSFVLKSPFEACKQLQSECRDSLNHIPWSDIENIEMSIYGDEQSLKNLKEVLDISSEDIYPDFYSGFCLGVSATTFFGSLVGIFDGAYPEKAKAFSKITSIQFSVDDYDRSGVRMLCLLYQYFEQNCKADVNRDDSEHDFELDGNYDFATRLQELVSEKAK